MRQIANLISATHNSVFSRPWQQCTYQNIKKVKMTRYAYKMDRNALEEKLDTNNPISRVKYNEN